jgi:hypothetical protein
MAFKNTLSTLLKKKYGGNIYIYIYQIHGLVYRQ